MGIGNSFWLFLRLCRPFIYIQDRPEKAFRYSLFDPGSECHCKTEWFHFFHRSRGCPSWHNHAKGPLPSPLARFPLLLSNPELLMKAFNGHERCLHRPLHGNPELTLLVAELRGNFFQ